MMLAAWLAVRFCIAVKPAEYSWRQLCGAGVLAGFGFTISLFIAGEAFPDPADFAAEKIAIFIASLVAGILGAAKPDQFVNLAGASARHRMLVCLRRFGSPYQNASIVIRQ